MKSLMFIILSIIVFSFTFAPSAPKRWELQGEKLDPVNINVNLLETTIVDYINYKRKKTRRREINLNVKLDSVVGFFSKEYANKELFKRRRKLRQSFYSKSREIGHYNSWFKALAKSESAILIGGKTAYFDEGVQKYCWGSKGQKGDPVPFKFYTYRQFAKLILSRSYPASHRRWLNNSEVDKIGINIKINRKNFPARLPRVEVLFAISGNVMPAKL